MNDLLSRTRQQLDAATAPLKSDEQVWEDIFVAFEELAEPPFPLHVANVMRRWAHTKNPFFADYALLLCKEEGLPIPPAMVACLGTVAFQRLSGQARAGTHAAVAKVILEDRAYRLMANLCSVGVTMSDAASKAAQDLKSVSTFKKVPKASTLERGFAQSWWRTQVESLRASHVQFGRLEAWEKLAKELPEADADLEGVRR